jgi:general secretion pathway protein G
MVKRVRRVRGFTLIELLVVLAILATLLALVAPRYFDSLERAKEVALRTDLRLLRETIDKYRADTGHLPLSLLQLVQEHYIRAVPVDPITELDDTWVLVPSQDTTVPGIHDVRSGAVGTSRDGTPYAAW